MSRMMGMMRLRLLHAYHLMQHIQLPFGLGELSFMKKEKKKKEDVTWMLSHMLGIIRGRHV